MNRFGRFLKSCITLVLLFLRALVSLGRWRRLPSDSPEPPEVHPPAPPPPGDGDGPDAPDTPSLRMRYRDKSSNNTVILFESRTDFLVLAEPGEAESVAPALFNQKVFTVTPSTNNDGVFVFQARSDNESNAEIERAVEALKGDDRIKAVVPALLDDAGEVRFALPGRVVVRFKGVAEAAVKNFLKSLKSGILRSFGAGLYEVSLPAGTELPDFIDALNENPNVAFAEPSFYGVNDQEIRIQVSPTLGFPRINIKVNGNHPPAPDPEPEPDPDPIPPDPPAAGGEEPPPTLPLNWNLNKLDIARAWRLTTGSGGIVIGVVDGLPDTEHEAIANKFIVPPGEETTFTGDPSVSSHATQISSIIAGESARVMGAAPGVRLLPLVVNLNSQVYAERAGAILKAVELARAGEVGGVRFSRLILSCSWRTRGDVAAIRTALEEAVEANVLVVFSAGNDATSAAHFPSDYSRRPGPLADGVLCVAATDMRDAKAVYSNYSPNVDVSAPGGDGLPLDDGDILCADQAGTYAFGAGTSLAAPHVAAVAALMLSLNPALTPAQIKRIIRDTADDISTLNPGFPNQIGRGRINAFKAVRAVTELGGNSRGVEDMSSVTERLAQYSRALRDATGWSLSAAEVSKGGETVTLDLT